MIVVNASEEMWKTLQQGMWTLLKTLKNNVNHLSVNHKENQDPSQSTPGFQFQCLSKEHLRDMIVTKDLLNMINPTYRSGGGVPLPLIFLKLHYISSTPHSVAFMSCLLMLCPWLLLKASTKNINI